MNGVHNTPHPKSCACQECRNRRAAMKKRGRQILALSKTLDHSTPEMMKKANELIGKVFRGEI